MPCLFIKLYLKVRLLSPVKIIGAERLPVTPSLTCSYIDPARVKDILEMLFLNLTFL